MIVARRVMIGTDPVDLTEGSGLSGTTIQLLRNRGTSPLFVSHQRAEPEGPIVLGIFPDGRSEDLPQVTLGPQDKLFAWRDGDPAPADLIVSWG